MTGIERIAAERRRQIEEEGWTAEHDADRYHKRGELAEAACYYAWPEENTKITPWLLYPDTWSTEWGKRCSKTRIRQLEVAGALIAAEIDRLQAEEWKV